MTESKLIQTYHIDDKEFIELKNLIYEHTGINLNDHKKELVVSRLSKRLRSLELISFKEYLHYLKNRDVDQQELHQMINRITTNKTDFYRENHHFEYIMKEYFPKLIAQQPRGKLVVWSAGCSSGEEPYTLAIVLQEICRVNPQWDYHILATDLDTDILTKASTGIYRSSTIAPVPEELRKKYFSPIENEGEMLFQAKPVIRDKISFYKLNFKLPDYKIKTRFDFIFFRNVMIYFDNDLKNHILTQFHNLLKENGLIFIGHSESLLFYKDKFQFVKNTIYRKVL